MPEMFTKTPGWYLQCLVYNGTHSHTEDKKLAAETEEEAKKEAALLWDKFCTSPTEDAYPTTAQLVYFSHETFER